jgi:hypothetical protein
VRGSSMSTTVGRSSSDTREAHRCGKREDKRGPSVPLTAADASGSATRWTCTPSGAQSSTARAPQRAGG